MGYIEEYEKIFDGGAFIRDGKTQTFDTGTRIFDGGGIKTIINLVMKELETRQTVTVLDFGCGEAVHWTKDVVDNRAKNLPAFMGEKLQGFYRYDPANKRYSRKPVGTFDFIICSDVLEHIPETEVPGFIKEVNSYGNKGAVIFYSICTRPSKNFFLDKTNMHITQKSSKWWFDQISKNSTHKTHMSFDS